MLLILVGHVRAKRVEKGKTKERKERIDLIVRLEAAAFHRAFSTYLLDIYICVYIYIIELKELGQKPSKIVNETYVITKIAQRSASRV